MTIYNTIIRIEQMLPLYEQQDCLLIDCRYDLAVADAGHSAYLEAHIPGAIYADIQGHLAGEALTDKGRHPMPGPDKLVQVFSSFGIEEGKQLVVYDASSGAFAARLWWLLRYMGHEAVALLDGGWQAWIASSRAVEAGEITSRPTSFRGKPKTEWLVLIDEVERAPLLVDSRDAARYRGDEEPIDPVAGHIPGAINRCWKENLAEDGCFLDAERLNQQFRRIYAGTAPTEVVFYCGSGVTACHNLLAVAHAGLPAARLYAGSWSEWCKTGDKPVARGSD